MARRKVAAYPWQSLDRVTHRGVRASAAVRRRVEKAVDLSALARALGSVAGTETDLVVHHVAAADSLPTGLGTTLAFELTSEAARIDLAFEPELATLLLARVLGRAPPLSSTALALEPALRGALAAIVIEACRRTKTEVALRIAEPPGQTASPEEQRETALVDVTLLVEGQPFPVRAFAQIGAAPTRAVEPAKLSALGELSISVPLVVGLALLERAALVSLQPGDAWLAGAGWWIDGKGVGRGALASPRGELGQAVDLAPDGRIVVRGERLTISSDPDGAMADSDQTTGQLADVVLEAPLVVRVELGAVTLTAREWAALRPGDVIETGRRISEPAVLRIAGREVARGELVNIEGELGVRVLQILEPASDA